MLRPRHIAFGCLPLSLAWLVVASLHAQAPALENISSPPPALPAASGCPSQNLVRGARIDALGITGARFRASDGVLAVEGTEWNSTPALQLTEPSSRLTLDLHEVYSIGALLLQGDNNDQYVIEGSEDGVRYRPVWTAPPTEVGFGLRSRWVQLKARVSARYLRVRGQGGDGFYSISELQAFCKPDARSWPPKLRNAPVKHGWDAITNEVMVAIKGLTAALGMVVLILLWRWQSSRRTRWGDYALRTLLTTLALLPFIALWSVGHYRFDYLVSAWADYRYLVVGLAVTVALVALFWWWSRPERRSRWRGGALKTTLALLGLLSFANWWNLGHYHFDHYIHIWEHYHYYVGAKYPELRYARLYECTAVADMEDGLRDRVVKRKMRALATDNHLGTTAEIVADPSRCKKHFTEARWQQFRKDIRFFRGRFSRDRWDQSQNDHGYNATPVWAIAGRIIAERYELSWEQITRNGIIDSVALGLMWLVVWWAFGWQATCVALLWWGCNFPARYYWNGGSYLRYDWLLWLTVGVCLLKKRYHALGGAALTYATLLRIFPGFVVAAIVLKALYRMGRERRFVLSREHWRFAAGCVVAMAVLLPAGSWASNGFDAWGEFAENSKKHLNTALTNNMGLKTVMAYEFGTRATLMRNDKIDDPFEDWKDARSFYYHKRFPVYLGLILLFCVMLARAGDRDEDWVAACLGTGLIAMASELTCYYYGFLLTYGLLWERRRLPGVLAAGLAGLTAWLSVIAWNDDHFGAMSLATTLVIIIVTAHAAFGKIERPVLAVPAPPPPVDPLAPVPLAAAYLDPP